PAELPGSIRALDPRTTPEVCSMGLAEKRATQKFQETHFAQFKKEIADAIGADIPITVDWDKLAMEDYAEKYEMLWSNGCFRPLIEALRAVGSDAMGKQALRDSLKAIDIKGDYAHNITAKFAAGMLHLDFRLYNDPGGPGSKPFSERKLRIQTALEKG